MKAVSRWCPFRLPTIGNLSHRARAVDDRATGRAPSGADYRVLAPGDVLRNLGAMNGTHPVSDDGGPRRRRGFGGRLPRDAAGNGRRRGLMRPRALARARKPSVRMTRSRTRGLLGHRDATVTRTVYVREIPDARRRAM